MKAPFLAVSRVIAASPEMLYYVLSDYTTEHPQILPTPYFESLVVEEGGHGAGTVFRAEMRVMGMRQTLHMRVTEPEPGRELRETDPVVGVTTTFTVTPEAGGTGSLVEIVTEWRAKSGLVGLLERLLLPAVTRPIYLKELDLLAAHVRPRR